MALPGPAVVLNFSLFVSLRTAKRQHPDFAQRRFEVAIHCSVDYFQAVELTSIFYEFAFFVATTTLCDFQNSEALGTILRGQVVYLGPLIFWRTYHPQRDESGWLFHAGCGRQHLCNRDDDRGRYSGSGRKTCAHAPYPFGGGILSGDTGLAVPEGVKGAVQLKGPEGAIFQAKF